MPAKETTSRLASAGANGRYGLETAQLFKRGSRYLRVLLVQGGLGGADPAAELGALRAQSVYRSCQDARHRNVLAIALANKLASIA